MANTMGFGVNLAYRNVKPAKAAEDMMDLLFYPSKGDRVVAGKSGKGR